MRKAKSLCIYCGSSMGAREEYQRAAQELGRSVAQHGYRLVYGGGHIGLMGILADSVLAAGGEAIGVIPQWLVDREVAHLGLTKLHVVETMHQRKQMMAELADAFVALPGGYGTLDELCEVLGWAQLGLHSKPIVLFDVAGYWQPLFATFDQAAREGFLRSNSRNMAVRAETAAEIFRVLHQHWQIG